MENTQPDDLTTRTANLKRQLLEKMQQRENTPQPRTTSDPPRTTTGTASPSEIKAAHPLSQPPSAPITKLSSLQPPATSAPAAPTAPAAPAAPAVISTTIAASAPVATTAPAPDQLRLDASDNDLTEFIAGISSALAANHEGIVRVQNQGSTQMAATTGPPVDYRVVPSPSQAPKTLQAPQAPQAPPQQAPYFDIPGLNTGSMNGAPLPLVQEQARWAAHVSQPAPKQHTVSGSWSGYLQEPALPPSERNPINRENGTPTMANRPSGMSAGQPPSAAHNGSHISSYTGTTPQATTALKAATPLNRGPGSSVSNVRLTPEELRDLRDWLVHTNFYDVGYRQMFLSRRRRLAALEEERLRLLQEEESSRYGRLSFQSGGYMPSGSQGNPPAMGPPSNSMHGERISPPGVPGVPSTISHPPMATHPKSPDEDLGKLREAANSERLGMLQQGEGFDHRQSVKRARPEIENSFIQRDPQERPSKISRTEDDTRLSRSSWSESKSQAEITALPPVAAIATESSRGPVRAMSGSARVAHGDADRSAPSVTSKPTVLPGASGTSGASASASASSSAATPSGLRDRDGAKTPLPPLSPLLASRHRHTSPGKIKSEHDEPSYSSLSSWKVPRHNSFSSTNHYGPHPPIDLGHKGDTKFFLIKPLTEKYVDDAMRDNVWSTSQSTGDILRNKFRAKRNVILFFSVNKSRAFQGYARMMGEPSPSIPRPDWMTRSKWMASPPFQIEWLNKSTMSNHFAHSNKNSYNDNMPVTVGLDGQEIEDSSGRALIQSMEVNKYKQGQKEKEKDKERDSPKGKFESSSSYLSKGNGSAKKTRPSERTWGKPYHSSMSDHGYNRPYSPDRDRR